ncbi:MAG: VOC family protein [Deltaproteobacteria bacterium]|nr:VOC family protein [Deltaproteobacteria bacterium]MBW2416386.1 VOC family protein [Deltaproteobacteria bacterium]
MTPAPRLRFSHIGIHVHDMKRMVEFYTGLLGLEETDRGKLPLPGEPEIVFLSADPAEHHQIALVEGRRDGGIEAGVVNQLSFHVENLAELRRVKQAAEARGVERFMPLSHGRGWSLYFPDPEGNGIECFVDTPWHVRQPVVDPLDLSLSDEEILRQTEETYRDTPDFEPMEDWRAALAKRIEKRWSD